MDINAKEAVKTAKFFDAEVIKLEAPHSEGWTWFASNEDHNIVVFVGCANDAKRRIEEQGLNPLYLLQLSDEEIESLL